MQLVHPRPQTPQGESVAKFGTSLLIILSVACQSHIEEVPFLFCGQKHPWEVDLCRNRVSVSHTLIISYWVNIANIRYRATGRVRPPYAIPFSINKASIYKSHIPSFRHLNTNYIKQCSSYFNQTRDHQEKTPFYIYLYKYISYVHSIRIHQLKEDP